MLSQTHYLIRSKQDGQYLAAQPQKDVEVEGEKRSYLLIFREHFDALGYLNKYAQDVADNFAVESVSSPQLKSLLQRWSYFGIALVEDPLIPRIKFFNV